MTYSIGKEVVILKEVSITGREIILPTPIYGRILNIKVQESHSDSYGEYWPPAICYTIKTLEGETIYAYNKESHRSGYIL